MTFLRWLENMRAKPVKSRRLAAFAISLSVTGFLFVIWLSVLLPGFFGDQTLAQKNAQTLDEVNQSFETPQHTIFQNIQTAWNSLGQEIGSLKAAVTNVQTPNLGAASAALGDVHYVATSTISTKSAVVSSTTSVVTITKTTPSGGVVIVSTTSAQ